MSVTFFTVPRPFNGFYSDIQHQAIQSWVKISNNIILCGNEQGVKDYAEKYNLIHIQNIIYKIGETSELKHYFWDDICNKSLKECKTEYLVRISTDCILEGDIDKCIESCLPLGDFMIVSQRYDSDGKDIPKLHSPCGIDIHIAKKEAFQNIPPFLVGFGGEDNWLALKYYDKKTLVDATNSIILTHQNHERMFSRKYGGDTDSEYRYNQELFISSGGGTNINYSQYTLDNYLLKERIL